MRGISLGRIFGLPIRIDYSWFIIFFLILWTFTFGVFPASAPGLSTATYVAMGVTGTLLFFVSLLAHELSHSIVARSRGIPVEGITLFIFGGMAHTRMEAEDPGDEFVIAGVGPLSSVLIGLFFGVIAILASGSPAIAAVAQYLAFINVALAVFNLLPGFPLDGGRLFRAAAWKVTGNLTRATRMATTGGRLVGYGLIALGVVQIFMTASLIAGLWLIFIGWFVRTAAEASFRQHLLRQSLDGVRVEEVMTSPPETVPADLPLSEFVDRFILHGRHRAYPVVDDGSPVGLMPVDRLREIPREEWSARTVRDAMVPLAERMTVRPHEKLLDVLDRLGSPESNGRIVVTHDGAVDGVLTRADLTRWVERAELMGEEAA